MILTRRVSCVYVSVQSVDRTAPTQVVSPTLSEDEGVTTAGLFRKRYDAYPSENALGGTCMQGQLLDEGYLQEQANGR